MILNLERYNESCELSEECQSSDGNSFCSAYGRCQCIAEHKIDNNKCTNRLSHVGFPYAIIFGTIAGLITIVVISLLFYKYYFLKRFRDDLKLGPQSRKLNKHHPQHQPSEIIINLTAKKSNHDDETSTENDNIYDDIDEIRYVTNQKNA